MPRIILCNIEPGATPHEKETLSQLGFDLKTLEEKAETVSIVLPPHLEVKEGNPSKSSYLYHDDIFFNDLKILSIHHSRGMNSHHINFSLYANSVSLAIKQIREQIGKTFQQKVILTNIRFMSPASGKCSPAAVEMSANHSSTSNLNLEPLSPATPLLPDRSENGTPFTVMLNGVKVKLDSDSDSEEEDSKTKKLGY